MGLNYPEILNWLTLTNSRKIWNEISIALYSHFDEIHNMAERCLVQCLCRILSYLNLWISDQVLGIYLCPHIPPSWYMAWGYYCTTLSNADKPMDTLVIFKIISSKFENSIIEWKFIKISLANNFRFECMLFRQAVIFGNRTTLEKFFAGLIVEG